MSCRSLCDLCFGFSMETLVQEDMQQFEHHLKLCTRCQAEHAELIELRKLVESSFSNPTTKTYQRGRLVHQWAYAGLTAAVVFSVLTGLTQNRALANRLHETAHDLRSGISHPTVYLRAEALRILDDHFRKHLKPARQHTSVPQNNT